MFSTPVLEVGALPQENPGSTTESLINFLILKNIRIDIGRKNETRSQSFT